MNLVEFLYLKYLELILTSTFGHKKQHNFVSRCPQKNLSIYLLHWLRYSEKVTFTFRICIACQVHK